MTEVSRGYRGGDTFITDCPNLPGGTVNLSVPKSFAGTFGILPRHACPTCGVQWPVLAYLKRVEERDDGYGYWTNGAECHTCDPPEPVWMLFTTDYNGGKRLMMRLDIHLPNVRWWDRRLKQWATILELRRLEKGSNKITPQPYKRRKRQRI